MVGTVKKSIDTVVFTWFSRKVRHVCEGGLPRWTMYLLTLVSPISIPSLRSSPWMRGAPQIGFSRLILRIRLQISFDPYGNRRLFSTSLPLPKHHISSTRHRDAYLS